MFIVINKRSLAVVLSVLTAFIFFIGFSSFKKNSAAANLLVSDTIVIDAGHGGIDGGSTSEDGVLEKDLNLSIAKKLEEIFTKNNYKVIMTRDTDISLHKNNDENIKNKKNSDLKERVRIANESQAALFISIHINQYEDSKIHGAQVFYKKGDSTGKNYSEHIMEALREVDTENKRLSKILPNKNYIFENLKIPGVLVECGFISNPDELKKLGDTEYQNKIANAIYTGIINSLN